MKVLITGGAGFIGTHLSRRLLALGHEITIIDNFLPQVHAGNQDLAEDLRPHVRLVRGDVADAESLKSAAYGAHCIVHLAAETGTGQSMYAVARYSQSNLTGTSVLLDLIANRTAWCVEKLVVASSRAIYGEGAYHCDEHGLIYPGPRSVERMQAGLYEPVCPRCGATIISLPTPESAPLAPTSFYGLTKQVQEQMILLFGTTLSIPSAALRYQNVFGPGQSLSNPYTGILAIFSNLARLNQPIRIFEDGLESRDFVFIDDVIEATSRAVESSFTGSHSLNVGTGRRVSVLEVARQIISFFDSHSELQITGEFRLGDIRHGSADLMALHQTLGFAPQWEFADGLRNFLQWATESVPGSIGYSESLAEMRSLKLMRGNAADSSYNA